MKKCMAVYTFDRGKFHRWGVPMWAGETRAFKLIRLLRRQGIKGILYEEGPLQRYDMTDIVKPYCYHLAIGSPHKKPWQILDRVKHESKAAAWFRVSFDPKKQINRKDKTNVTSS